MTAVGPPSPPSPQSPTPESAPPVKRTRSDSSALADSDRASKRQKTDNRGVLYENSGDFYPIPDEVIQRLFSYLRASPLVLAGITCRRLLHLADRASMWKELCARAQLPVAEGASYRLEFLSAIHMENPDAYISKAYFFSTGGYAQRNKIRALAFLDHAINTDTFLEKNALSERQIKAVFQKKGFFRDPTSMFSPFKYAPGQITTLQAQLTQILTTCPLGTVQSTVILFQLFLLMKDASNTGHIPYSIIWKGLNSARLDERASERDRRTASYALCFMPALSRARWDPADLAHFQANHCGLSYEESIEILKECMADPGATKTERQFAKYLMLRTHQYVKPTQLMTDQEAYALLESLNNERYLCRAIDRKELESMMKKLKQTSQTVS